MVSNVLNHHGIKGMHWGVRRYQNPDGTWTSAGRKRYYEKDTLTAKTKSGETIYAYRTRPKGISKVLQVNKKVANEQDKTKDYRLFANGKKVGYLMLYKESNKTMNGAWLGIKETERGKGYAQAILSSALKDTKAKGFEQFTLEVPGHSPDARHIYEKQGFKVVEELSKPEEDWVWSGLTSMKKKLR